MTKPRVLVSCFPYFINNFIAYDFFIFKEKNKMNKMFEILVMIFLFEKIIIISLWKPVQFFKKIFIHCPIVIFKKKLKVKN